MVSGFVYSIYSVQSLLLLANLNSNFISTILGKEYDCGREDRALDEACAAGKADDGRGPQSGGGGKALDLTAACDNDRAGADEADAGDDLRSESADIGVKPEAEQQVLAGQRRYCRAQADQNVRAEAGRAALYLALGADDRAAYERKQQAQRHGQRCGFPYKIKA